MSEPYHRHEIWGDDPEERDADAVVAEIGQTDGDLDRRWHDHPTVVPFKAVALFIGHNAKRIAVTIAGVVVLLIGLAGLLLPVLPGWLLIFVGLGILSTEYVWARRLLERAREVATVAKDKAVAKKDARAAKKEARRSSAGS
jgi:uncharacterized protein (TIGR02611 family)